MRILQCRFHICGQFIQITLVCKSFTKFREETLVRELTDELMICAEMTVKFLQHLKHETKMKECFAALSR